MACRDGGAWRIFTVHRGCGGIWEELGGQRSLTIRGARGGQSQNLGGERGGQGGEWGCPQGRCHLGQGVTHRGSRPFPALLLP